MTPRYRNSSAGRLASQFPKRLAQGSVIDRTKTTRGGKIVKTIGAPEALLRFFRVPEKPVCSGDVYSCPCAGCVEACKELMEEREYDSRREERGRA